MTEPSPTPHATKQVLVWNLPARVSHWGFSLSLSVSLWLGFQFDPESTIFKYHILAGVLACWFLGVRLVLGIVGSKPMRWSAFFKAVSRLSEYAREVCAWRTTERAGLNAGSVSFALTLYLVLIGLIYTGFMADLSEMWHGRLAYGSIFLICLHLLGLGLHALRTRSLSPLAMIHGKTQGNPDDALTHSSVLGGSMLAMLSFCAAWLLYRYFNADTSVLQIPLLPEITFPVIQKG